MPLLPLAFTLLLLASAGAALFATLGLVRRARVELAARVGLVTRGMVDSGFRKTVQVEHDRIKWRAALEVRSRRWFSVGLSRTWGMRSSLLALWLTAVGGGGVAWFFLRLTAHLSVMAAVSGTLAAVFLVPRALLKHEQSVADRQFQASLPDAIDMVVRMLRAGLPVTAAIRSVGNEAPPPLDGVFTRIADQMGIGIPFDEALRLAAERVGLADFRFFAIAISLQRATGGNLASTLGILSELMRKRRAMRQKAKAATGEVRMSAYILGGIPFLVIGALLVTDPYYLKPLISDPRGNVIVGAATMLLIMGFATMQHMMRSVTRE